MNNNFEEVDKNSDKQRNASFEAHLLRSYKDEKGNFLYDACARDLESIDTYKTLKGTKKMYRYVPQYGYYRDDGEQYLQQQMRRLVGSDFRKNRFSEVLTMVQTDTFIEPNEFVPPVYLINLRNGYYDIQHKAFYERTKDLDYSGFCFVNCLPFEYKPLEYFYAINGAEGPCPRIDEFFHQVFENNQQDVDTLYEWFGFHLIRVYLYKKMAFFLGEPNTGKSTVAQLLITFVGGDSVSNISLKSFEDDKFEMIKLFGKLANISTEMSPEFMKDTSTIKMLTGRDQISPREMYSQREFKFTPYAKQTHIANKLPGTYEDDKAFYDRILLFIFKHVFVEGEDMDENFLTTLTTPDELSGLFIRSLDGLFRLLHNRRFTQSMSAVETKELYRVKANPVVVFFEKEVKYDPVFEISRKNLYADYVEFCKEVKVSSLTERAFGRYFERYVRKQNDISLYHPWNEITKSQTYTYKGLTTTREMRRNEEKDSTNDDTSEDTKKFLDDFLGL